MGYYMEYSNSLFLKVTLEQMRFVKLGFRHVHKGEHKAAAASFEHIWNKHTLETYLWFIET